MQRSFNRKAIIDRVHISGENIFPFRAFCFSRDSQRYLRFQTTSIRAPLPYAL